MSIFFVFEIICDVKLDKAFDSDGHFATFLLHQSIIIFFQMLRYALLFGQYFFFTVLLANICISYFAFASLFCVKHSYMRMQ